MVATVQGVVQIDVIASPSVPEILKVSPTLLRVNMPYYGYQWYRYGGVIPGATYRDYNVTQSGVYSVEVMSAGGCFRMSNPVGMGVGVSVHELNSTPLHLYPNPSDGNCYMYFPDQFEGEFNVEVYDVLGKLVHSVSLNSNTNELNLTMLAKGRYHVVFVAANFVSKQSVYIR